jgi:NAD-dependent deacetylase
LFISQEQNLNIPKLKPDDFIVILTGAGISAESGVKTFRDYDGLWENHRVEDVATPAAFQRNPAMVWRFYKARYTQSTEVKPNPGHYALVELEKKFGDNFLLVTQNVDGLHTVAGSHRVLEMHGSLHSCFCVKCDSAYPMNKVDLDQDIPLCDKCGKYLRPDIVWFGEIPYHLDEIGSALEKVTVFMSIGTSGAVYPAAYFIAQAQQRKAMTIGLALERPDNAEFMDYFFAGKSGELLPDLVKEWLVGS